MNERDTLQPRSMYSTCICSVTPDASVVAEAASFASMPRLLPEGKSLHQCQNILVIGWDRMYSGSCNVYKVVHDVVDIPSLRLKA